MLIECKNCEATLDAEVLHSYEFQDQETMEPERISFLKCPRCEMPLLTLQGYLEDTWSRPIRIFPPQDKTVNHSFPKPIRKAYVEANLCFKAKAFTASAIMCRKTLQGICRHHGIKTENLKRDLEKMKDEGIIESDLFKWADALRDSGNEAAHDVNLSIKSQDAKDIIEFTDALLEYVFTFRDKFDKFIERRQSAK